MIDKIQTPFTPLNADFSGKVKPQNLEQAAEQFEAMFLRSMLKEMRKASDVFNSETGMFSSRESRTLRDFHDDALAHELASQRSTGIADLLIKQLTPRTASAKRHAE